MSLYDLNERLIKMGLTEAQREEILAATRVLMAGAVKTYRHISDYEMEVRINFAEKEWQKYA